ncbi:thymidylate kinase [Streptomyces sp. TRM66268-LWL]|uniref:Thymidylate kinase n=2 Tax=Streptomyces polyasparticus TaxID=2767826 RepID=A0ABR7SW00_9ACTN|nr:thymidylate kinase [Streptomyces polyasparticus]
MNAVRLPTQRLAARARRPLWISCEGINGVGKTTVTRALAARIGERCLLLDELTDQGKETLPGRVIAALAAQGDVFLRTGHPAVETLALLALKVRETERLAGRADVPEVVLEDRGLDSVAVYQAAILGAHQPENDPRDVARHVLATMTPWRHSPDATVLLSGDHRQCTQRFAQRIGRTLTARDVQIIECVDALYADLAAAEPGRYRVIDTTGRPVEEVVAEAALVIEDVARQKETDHAA